MYGKKEKEVIVQIVKKTYSFSFAALWFGLVVGAGTYLQDAWGNEIGAIITTSNAFRWLGQLGYHWDQATGNYYVRARMYSPTSGCWMSQDPLLYPAVYADGINTYLYVGGNPIRHVDPEGLGIVDCCKAIAELMKVVGRASEHIEQNIGFGGPLDKGHVKEKKQIATELQQAIAKVEKHCAQVAKDALDKAKEILDKIKEQIDALFEAIDQGDLMKAAQILSILLGLLVAAMIVLAAWLCPVVPPCPP